MSRILITGAAGYIGGVILKYVPQDWEVVVFDLKEPKFALPFNARFVKGNITDESLMLGILNGVDIILHLAAMKGSDNCRTNPVDTVEVNICGTHNLIKAALLKKVNKFVFLSSYWVYGEDLQLPFAENTVARPSELYGLSKAVSEQELILSGLDYAILRFSNVFGFGISNSNEEVVFNFIRSAFEDRPIKLMSGGKQKLDFIDIDDACKCLQKIVFGKGVSKCTLNVGSGIPTSIAELAQIVSLVFKRNYKKNVAIETVPSVDMKISDRWVSIDKLKSKIGEVNFRTLEQSIEEYARQYKEKIYDKSCKTVLQ